jgi:hypothetical protein
MFLDLFDASTCKPILAMTPTVSSMGWGNGACLLDSIISKGVRDSRRWGIGCSRLKIFNISIIAILVN